MNFRTEKVILEVTAPKFTELDFRTPYTTQIVSGEKKYV